MVNVVHLPVLIFPHCTQGMRLLSFFFAFFSAGNEDADMQLQTQVAGMDVLWLWLCYFVSIGDLLGPQ